MALRVVARGGKHDDRDVKRGAGLRTTPRFSPSIGEIGAGGLPDGWKRQLGPESLNARRHFGQKPNVRFAPEADIREMDLLQCEAA